MTAAGDARLKKERAARLRACFEEELTHLRIGTWNDPGDPDAVTFVGMVYDLHGTVCTCCPRRDEAAS